MSKKKASKQKSKAKQKPIPYPRIKTPSRIVILFGLDDQDQPRAAQFSEKDDAVVTRIAKGLGLRIGLPVAAHQIAVANMLPKGDVHATGTESVPIVDLELYSKVCALVGGDLTAISPAMPSSHDAIEPGHLVLALDSLADGWWPAVVLKRHQQNLVMKWRDYPGQGEFIRAVRSVALLTSEQSS